MTDADLADSVDKANRQTFTRRQALASQVDSAIWSLCVRNEPIVANLVANAAIDVLRSLAKAAGEPTFKGRLEEHVKPEFLKEFRSIERRAYNQSKHADSDPEADIELDTEFAALNVLAATVDFGQVFKSNTAFMGIFRAFALAKRPDHLIDGEFREMHEHFAKSVEDNFVGQSLDDICKIMLIQVDERPNLVDAWPQDHLERR